MTHRIADLLSPESWAALRRLGYHLKREPPPEEEKRRAAQDTPELTAEQAEIAREMRTPPTRGYARYIGGGPPPS